MKQIRQIRLALALMMLAVACAEKKLTPEELLANAKSLHLQVLATNKQVAVALRSMEGEIADKGIPADSLATWHSDYQAWKLGLVEVPGMGHAHHDHSDPDFEHLHIPNLTPEQHHDVQKELLNDIENLKKRILSYYEFPEKK